jgi:hypothetical protein
VGKNKSKKMYYTDEEAAAKLGIDAAALEALVQDQKLRVFKDGPRNMFRVSDVDELAAQGVGGGEEEIELTPADTGGASSISLADSAQAPPEAGKEDTVITAEGVSIFDEGEEVETADPLAKTQITMRMEDQGTPEGSGSGLLDLTRESDDTSLGEVLDKIEMDSGVAPIIEEAVPAAAAAVEPTAPAVVEAPDPMIGLFSGLIIGGAVAGIVLAAVSLAAMTRSVPGYLEFFGANKPVVLAVFAVALIAGAVAGQVVLKPAGSKGP